MGLPSLDSLSLSETVISVVKRCDCSDAEAKQALKEAGLNGRLKAYGFAPLTTLREPRDDHPRRREDLRSGDWSSKIAWEADRMGRYYDVRLTLCSIEAWLNSGQGAKKPKSPSAPTSSVEAEQPEADTEVTSPNDTGAATLATPEKHSGTRTGRKVAIAYEKRLRDFLSTQSLFPTSGEDMAWARENNFNRDAVRCFRARFLPDKVKKGGRRKKLNRAEVDAAIKSLAANEEPNLATKNLAAKLPS